MRPEAAWAEAMKHEHRADPYPFFDELRKTPVAKVAEDTYVVTGYEELLALAHDPRISSDMRRTPQAAHQAGTAKPPPGVGDFQAYGNQMFITSDPPAHDRARRQVWRHFGPPHSPDLIPGLEPEIVRLCNALLDKVKGKGDNRLDVVDEYAYPVPVTVISKVLGVPLKDEPMFHGWIYDIVSGMGLGPEATTEEGKSRAAKGLQAAGTLVGYLAELIEQYLREPAEGLLSELVNDNEGPDGPMSPADAVATAGLLLIAGHDTTVNTISNCVLTLLRNPGSFELLRNRPELIPRAIEEVQRLESAIQWPFHRSATADIEIGGTVIPNGASVYLAYAAANRDPARFANPNSFDPLREDNQHFGFGSGIHTCMGGSLARLEINTALEIFLRRVDNPRLVVDPPPYRQSQALRGPQHLLIDFDQITD